jgi:hypothetical protein
MKRPLRLGEGMQTEQGWHATDCQPIVSRRSIRVRRIHKRVKTLVILVGAAGFEPATPCAQGRCATRLRYAPTLNTSLYRGLAQPPSRSSESPQNRSEPKPIRLP